MNQSGRSAGSASLARRGSEPGATPHQRSRRGLLLLLVGASLLACLGGGVIAYRGRLVAPADLPVVNLDGADPELVRVVNSAHVAVDQSPRSADAWGRLAMILHANGFSEAAHHCYGVAIELEPDSPQWPYLRGSLHYHGPGGPQAALPLFQHAARLSPPNSAARARLADNLLELGYLAEADQEYRRLLAADDADPLALLGLSKLAIVRQKHLDALPHLERIAENPLTQRQACALRASALDRLGKRASAEREWQRLANLPEDQLRPDDPVIFVMQLEVSVRTQLKMADMLAQEQRYGEMLAVVREAVRRYPNSVEAWVALANARGIMDDPVGAEQALLKCIELAPQSAETRLSLGHVQLWQRRYQEAAESVEKAIELEPQNGLAYFALGECRQGLKDPAGAREAYRLALRYAPDHPQAKQRLEVLSKNP